MAEKDKLKTAVEMENAFLKQKKNAKLLTVTRKIREIFDLLKYISRK
jgi:hypothetical protein